MKSILLACLAILALASCKPENVTETKPVETVVENSDWYILKAPDARSVQGVYGDIDKTLIITTGFKIYSTNDKGKTWKTGNYDRPIGLFTFKGVQDTVLVLDTKTFTRDKENQSVTYAKSPSYYSVDKGLTWLPYKLAGYAEDGPTVLLNKAYTTTGTEYKINNVAIGTGSEPMGILTSKGEKITLPDNHQIQSVYFDAADRLYISASAPFCIEANRVSFCKGETGVLYVSKKSKN